MEMKKVAQKKSWRHKNEGWGEEDWERKLLKRRWIIPHFYDVTLSNFLRLRYWTNDKLKTWGQVFSLIMSTKLWMSYNTNLLTNQLFIMYKSYAITINTLLFRCCTSFSSTKLILAPGYNNDTPQPPLLTNPLPS